MSMSGGRPMDVPIDHPYGCPMDICGCQHFYVESMSTWDVRRTVACRPNDVFRT